MRTNLICRAILLSCACASSDDNNTPTETNQHTQTFTEQVERVQQLYAAHCAECHGDSGQGLSAAEVAECLAIPEETVRTRFFRARRALQLNIEQQLMASASDVYAFHLLRCDRVVAAVLQALQLADANDSNM